MRDEKLTYSDLQKLYSDDVLSAVLKASRGRNYLWHVALPKSGTTWLSNIIGQMYQSRGGVVGKLVPDYGTRPQEIDPRYFINTAGKDVFFRQQHCVWSRYTERLVRLTQTKIVFQHRDLLDVLMSLRDHIDDAIHGSQVEKHTLPPGIHNLDEQQILDYVIDVQLPWYCTFLDGWMTSELAGEPEIFHTVRYEELVDSPIATLKKMVSALNLGFEDEEIQAAYNLAGEGFTRRNKGVIGRGKFTLSDIQLDRIKRIVQYYNLQVEL